MGQHVQLMSKNYVHENKYTGDEVIHNVTGDKHGPKTSACVTRCSVIICQMVLFGL